jgi:hypothetical protein
MVLKCRNSRAWKEVHAQPREQTAGTNHADAGHSAYGPARTPADFSTSRRRTRENVAGYGDTARRNKRATSADSSHQAFGNC